MSPLILAARPTDARLIIGGLRVNSVKEIEQIGSNKVELIEAAIKRAQYSWTGWIDGEVACIWGVETQTIMGDAATLWLISTDLVEKHRFTFVRKSQIFIQELISQRFALIHGYVDPKFDRSRRWLKWLGFTLVPQQNGSIYFYMSRV